MKERSRVTVASAWVSAHGVQRFWGSGTRESD